MDSLRESVGVNVGALISEVVDPVLLGEKSGAALGNAGIAPYLTVVEAK